MQANIRFNIMFRFDKIVWHLEQALRRHSDQIHVHF